MLVSYASVMFKSHLQDQRTTPLDQDSSVHCVRPALQAVASFAKCELLLCPMLLFVLPPKDCIASLHVADT